jgi:hypothetical protein
MLYRVCAISQHRSGADPEIWQGGELWFLDWYQEPRNNYSDEDLNYW